MDIKRQDGIAMLTAIMAMLLMSALGLALVLTTATETMIASNFQNASEGLYAADGAIERAIDDLLALADWNPLLTGTVQSTFVDGPPNGTRTLGDNSTIDLAQVVNKANCGKVTCIASDLVAVTTARPWGANNPIWNLYAYGSLRSLLPATIDSAFYVVVMVGDDPSENDGNPRQDGALPCPAGQNGLDGRCNPGSGVLALRGEAFGPRGAHKGIEVTVSRTDATQPGPARMRLLSWREIR